MRTALFVALLAPLALFGCKKKEPEPAPVAAAPAPAPAPSPLKWAFGPATFDGSRTTGTGNLYVPFTVTNGSDRGLQLTLVGLTVLNGDDKACTGKLQVTDKAPPGGEISGKLAFACDYTLLPSDDTFQGKVTTTYTLGDEQKDEKFSTSFTFKR